MWEASYMEFNSDITCLVCGLMVAINLPRAGWTVHNCSEIKPVNASLTLHLFRGAAGDFDSPVIMTFRSFAQFYHFVLPGMRKLTLCVSIPLLDTVKCHRGEWSDNRHLGCDTALSFRFIWTVDTHTEQEGQYTYNVTQWCVSVTILAEEKQYVLANILWVCFSNLVYPACKAHAPYNIFICALSGSTKFFHIISWTSRFLEVSYWIGNVCFDFL
jgi:hypothetical protein